ncbi:MAG: biopolymer transporter ExbD [Deltaproteobacteria bacterium HGW-Deltaproteobacteria-17]|nr:MAG: biopolymer transporter ExbD [Deltaproteobacteria bacterium HGW-Deltaproteobacteria-17]
MNTWQNDDEDDGSVTGINVTPLVDTALSLLLVFMIVTPIIMNQAVKVKLPKMANAEAVQPTTVSVMLQKTGDILLNGKPVTHAELRVKLAELVAVARERAEDPAKPKIQAIIAADEEVAHGSVMHIVDIVKEMGVTEFAFNIKRVEKVPSP